MPSHIEGKAAVAVVVVEEKEDEEEQNEEMRVVRVRKVVMG